MRISVVYFLTNFLLFCIYLLIIILPLAPTAARFSAVVSRSQLAMAKKVGVKVRIVFFVVVSNCFRYNVATNIGHKDVVVHYT